MRQECARGRKGGGVGGRGGGRDYVGYGEGHGSDDNERGVNHSGQTVVVLTMRQTGERARGRLCI